MKFNNASLLVKDFKKGIATELMSRMVGKLRLRGFDKVTANSSPYGLPFYRSFGFQPMDAEQKKYGFLFTPMA